MKNSRMQKINVPKKLWFLIISIFLLSVVIILIAISNFSLELNEFEIYSEKLPQQFDKFRIAQISDFHNTSFGKDNKTILKKLFSAKPDIIVITGDLIDSRRTNVDIALNLAAQAVNIAPVYYVNGNHESRVPEYNELKRGLNACGVTLLEDDFLKLSIGNEYITLIGLNDPTFSDLDISKRLTDIIPDDESYKILLSHKPEYFESYKGKVDLVFSGHAHGGQFILPFAGGLIAPGQGFFPKYYEGVYEADGTQMIVSRGIGNSLFPFRINNNPEIITAILRRG